MCSKEMSKDLYWYRVNNFSYSVKPKYIYFKK